MGDRAARQRRRRHVTTDDEPARQQRGRQRPDRNVRRRVLRRRADVHPPDGHAAGRDHGPAVPLFDRRRVPRHRLVRRRRPGRRRGGDAQLARGRVVRDDRQAGQQLGAPDPVAVRPDAGRRSPFETQDEAGYLYRLEGNEIRRAASHQVHEVDPGELRRRDLEHADGRPDDARRGLRVPVDQDTSSHAVASRRTTREPGPTRPGSRDSWGSARRAGGTHLAGRTVSVSIRDVQYRIC